MKTEREEGTFSASVSCRRIFLLLPLQCPNLAGLHQETRGYSKPLSDGSIKRRGVGRGAGGWERAGLRQTAPRSNSLIPIQNPRWHAGEVAGVGSCLLLTQPRRDSNPFTYTWGNT
ncbi:hypothetical protein E2C01_053657 [Portunus trituberculatus]|uniref:Uncharacterized protein n=1 Tax=Portunus trituberculatus TaxID=210409 RepID=A0A5B7GKY6_PORTR|nr:hypothetical protein [Portunus trituberculatus]